MGRWRLLNEAAPVVEDVDVGGHPKRHPQSKRRMETKIERKGHQRQDVQGHDVGVREVEGRRRRLLLRV